MLEYQGPLPPYSCLRSVSLSACKVYAGNHEERTIIRKGLEEVAKAAAIQQAEWQHQQGKTGDGDLSFPNTGKATTTVEKRRGVL